MNIDDLKFDHVVGRALYAQVYDKMQNAILTGYFKKGDRLPSIRRATLLFHVSKTSVEHAYELLLQNGYIRSYPKRGYFVDIDQAHVALRREVFQHTDGTREPIIRFDFRSQTMDPASFDIPLWKKYVKEVLDHPQQMMSYGNAMGEVRLRVALCEYAYAMRGVLCKMSQIVIGSSFQSLLYIVCPLLPTACVLGMANDGFPPARTVCEDYKLSIRLFSYGEEGICIQDLYDSDVTLLYMNATTCGKKDLQHYKRKRKEVLQWAQKRNAYLLEDDHNGELRYQSPIMPALQGFDNGEHVIYIGSFSRLLLPSLRISYMVLPKQLIKRYMGRMDSYTPMASKMEQLALASYIRDGHLERHVKRLRKQYRAKSVHMYEVLKMYFKDVDIQLEEVSLQFALSFPKQFSLDRLCKQAAQHGIQIQQRGQQVMVLSFAPIALAEMEEAIQQLYVLYKKCNE